MRFLARVFVSLKPAINDPQGQTVLEGSGLMLGADSRLCDIKTETDRFPAPALMAWRLSASRVNSGF